MFRAGKLTQLTTDDTWLNAVLADSALNPASLERHPMRNVLTQAVGSQNDVAVHTTELELEPGDWLVLTTDGLHAVAGDEAIRSVLEHMERPEDSAKRLIQEARSAGGPDNISCVVMAIDGG